MEFKYYYDDKQEKCILTNKDFTNKSIEDFMEDKETLIIDIKEKNVNHLADFFRINTIKILLNETNENLVINDENIKDEEFYKDDSFQKLNELINDNIRLCNDTIRNCFAQDDDFIDDYVDRNDEIDAESIIVDDSEEINKGDSLNCDEDDLPF